MKTPLTPPNLGQLLYDGFDRSSLGSSWTTNLSSASAAISGNELLLSGGTGTVTEYIKYNAYPTCMERWTLSCGFKCTEKSATSFGFAIGIRGTLNAGSGQRSVYVQLNLTTGANTGKTFVRCNTGTNTTDSIVSTSSGAIVFSLNDEMQLDIERNLNTITTTVFNLTTGTQMSSSFTFPITFSQTNFMHATGMFAIYLFGGTQTVHYITTSSTNKIHPKICFIGDSITYGIYGTDVTTRYVNQSMLYSTQEYCVMGGPGDDTGSVITRLSEIVNMKSEYVSLMIGGNDILYGVSSATWQANYRTIRNTIKRCGIKVIHLLPTPRTATDVSALKNFIISEYSNVDPIVDSWTPLLGAGTSLNPTYNSGDNVHPNAAGHALVGTIIRNQAPFIFN